MNLNLVEYRDARPLLQSCDVLLLRGGRHWYLPILQALQWQVMGPNGWSRFGSIRNVPTHAAMVDLGQDGRIRALQSTAFGNKRPILSTMVADCDGLIDVYRLWPMKLREKWDSERTLLTMYGIIDRPYGWYNLLRAGVHHIPIWRFAVPIPTDDREVSSYPPFCSQAVAMAYRAGGVDLVKNRADRVTEPYHLAGPAMEYQFTLTIATKERLELDARHCVDFMRQANEACGFHSPQQLFP